MLRFFFGRKESAQFLFICLTTLLLVLEKARCVRETYFLVCLEGDSPVTNGSNRLKFIAEISTVLHGILPLINVNSIS